MKPEKRTFLFFLIFLFGLSVIATVAEQITLTTYYPSPRGEYETVRFFPSNPFTATHQNEGEDCSPAGAGMMYYQSTTNQLLYCYYDGTTYKWTQAGGGKYWIQTGSNLYAANASWNVGLGRLSADPTFKLSVDAPGGFATGEINIGGNSASPSLQVLSNQNAQGIYSVATQANSTGVLGNGVDIGVQGGTVLNRPLIGTMGVGSIYGLFGGSDDANPTYSFVGTYGTGTTYGVYGVSPGSFALPPASASTYGVYGQGGSYGVYGNAPTIGVRGEATGVGATYGVYGTTASLTSAGVYGGGTNFGVQGQATGVLGAGVEGRSPYFGVSGYGKYGVYGEGPPGVDSWGVYARSKSATNAYGVGGYASGTGVNTAVYALASGGTTNIGVDAFGDTYGILAVGGGLAGTAGRFVGNVTITGALSKGSGSFIQPHPHDPTKEINYVMFEGRESKVFFDGTATLSQGEARIFVPEDFRLVSSENNLNVILTPFGETEGLYVKEHSLQKIVVKERNHGKSNLSFGYLVIGTRRGFEEARPIQENVHFHPERQTTLEEFEQRFEPTEGGDYYSGLVRKLNRNLLVSNGTLLPSGKVNPRTMSSLGWKFSEQKKKAMLEK